MRVLLLPAPYTPYMSYYQKFPRYPLLNLCILASSIKDEHKVKIWEKPLYQLDYQGIVQKIDSFKPQIIGISAPSALSIHSISRLYPKLIKKYPSISFIIGGQFTCYCPEQLVKMGFHGIISGEGDHIFPRVIEKVSTFKDKATIFKSRHISLNISQKSGKNINIVEYDQILDLDKLPLPDFRVYKRKKRIYGFSDNAISLEISRGCPSFCNFCPITDYWGKFREKSPERIMEEIDRNTKNGADELEFIDHSFGINKNTIYQLCAYIRKKHPRLRFGAFMRADTITEDPNMMRELKSAGMVYSIVGFESYNARELKYMSKNTSPAQNYQAARILAKNDITVFGTHIYYHPLKNCGLSTKNRRFYGKKALLFSTLAAAHTFTKGINNCDIYHAGIFATLPGAPAWQERIIESRGNKKAGKTVKIKSSVQTGSMAKTNKIERIKEKTISQTKGLKPMNLSCLSVKNQGGASCFISLAFSWFLFIASLFNPKQVWGLIFGNAHKRKMIILEYNTIGQRLISIFADLLKNNIFFNKIKIQRYLEEK